MPCTMHILWLTPIKFDFLSEYIMAEDLKNEEEMFDTALWNSTKMENILNSGEAIWFFSLK